MRNIPSLLRFLRTAAFGTLLLAGCKQKTTQAEKTADGLTKIKVGYIGLTCEAPLYIAKEKGYFKEQGLDVEMVKCEWGQFKDLVGLGTIHVVHQPIMAFLKPIEEGLDVKLTAGIHRGCLRIQAPLGGNLKTVQDLKGKRIGVPGMGTPPFIFANRVLGDNGIDPRNDVQWKVFPSSELGLALEKGEVDAIANSEPIGLLLLADKKVQNISDQTLDEPYASEYCCGVIVNGKYAEANPDATAAVTKAIMKGAKWVETNPRAAAILSVEKKYILSNPELNAEALGRLRYIPSIAGGKEAIRGAAEGMKRAGILKPDMDIDQSIKKIYREYPGVNDEWLKSQEIEHVAMGQIQNNQWDLIQQELATIGRPTEIKTCCSASSKAAVAAVSTP
ncbi:ABC transporter substrate-binding protein [Luteolibacter sp. GHJ8]|uniref:ABC transporter substrate-binding protein n=1 Tax=Luteolibacter rhizosphaerae TaxID=2989719 RepID=A0ABT3FZP1_9BACT|nr:ABC transporter substrate-binding protein [Luteolibacter rhizosphaerae]MCW1913047.1 ABC transporter substrate-binding protein [Luteolibacter rhizosphaerae]